MIQPTTKTIRIKGDNEINASLLRFFLQVAFIISAPVLSSSRLLIYKVIQLLVLTNDKKQLSKI
jgi:hypothetical protein